MKIKPLKKILDILCKYNIESNESWLSAEHDQVWLPRPKNISEEDEKKLYKLGLFIDEKCYCFWA